MLQSISRYIHAFFLMQRYNWKKDMVYRTQWVLWLLIASFPIIVGFISISIIYNVSNGINGWTYYQLLALAGFSNLMIGTLGYVLNPWNLVNYMRNGSFDQLLLKPYNPIFMIISRMGWEVRISSMISALVLIIYGLINTQTNILAIATAFFMFALGTVAIIMFFILISVLSYVLFKSGNYIQWIINILGTASQYPLTIYSLAGMLLFTLLLPIGLASFYPAELLFTKIDYSLVFVLAVFAIILSYIFYKTTMWLLKFYTSGGG